MRKLATHKPPSRVRYEESHPVIAIRVDRGLYLQLMELKKNGDKSLGDILREALGIQKANLQKAFDRGFEEAKERYCITYPCSVCGKPMEITHDTTKEAVRRYMREHGWRHSSCIR